MQTPIEFLERAVASYAPFLREDGELIDPVIAQPTQYATPYHAWCNAVLAEHGPGDRSAALERACRGLGASLRHLLDVAQTPNISGFDAVTGAASRLNHRDFFWPATLKTHGVLRRISPRAAAEFDGPIKAVRITEAFQSRPPSNWAMVWLSGEWLRMQRGLSDIPRSQFDAWIDAMFQTISLETGFYAEPGHPNSYDLFTRVHLAELLLGGYDGPRRADMELLLLTGLTRSLGVQLSDGSLASAHRSTGQSWTLGAQVLFFTLAGEFLAPRQADLAQQASLAAERSFRAMTRCLRNPGPFSPVENCLPPDWRVGYESYTADAHYANLALGFLASAIQRGLRAESSLQALNERETLVWTQADPVWRGTVHCGNVSASLNAFPARRYDGLGLVDLTFGVGRWLHFASSVHHLSWPQAFMNLGIATRTEPLGHLRIMAQEDACPIEPLSQNRRGLRMRARLRGGGEYNVAVGLDPRSATITESTPGQVNLKTLLIPYLLDPGAGRRTTSDVRRLDDRTVVRLTLDAECLEIELPHKAAPPIELRHGYQNRRGQCALLRLDLTDPAETVTYAVRIVS
jgi:hypothetical protein